MKPNTFLVFHNSVMRLLAENGVPYEVRDKVSALIGDYKDHVNEVVNKILSNAHELM